MASPRPSKAIVTMIIGDETAEMWRRYSRPTWDAYAERHGYEIVALAEPVRPELVSAAKPVHWQKCFLLQHPDLAGYDYVVWIDADVLINHHRAPCIVGAMRTDRIGAVDLMQRHPTRLSFENCVARYLPLKGYVMSHKRAIERSAPFPTAELTRIYRDQAEKGAAEYAAQAPTVNTGVMVLQPRRHAEFLAEVFRKYRDVADSDDHEQTPLSNEIVAHDLLEPLDVGFNNVFYIDMAERYPFLHSVPLMRTDGGRVLARLCVTTSFLNSYFLHFVGGERDYMRLVETDAVDVFDLIETLSAD